MSWNDIEGNVTKGCENTMILNISFAKWYFVFVFIESFESAFVY